MTNQQLGIKGQAAVRHWLKNVHGITSTPGTYTDSFDLAIGEHRVEVKTARAQTKTRRRAGRDYTYPTWAFNIHRHGRLLEDELTAYILRLEGVPGFSYPIHLIVPAPIGKKTIEITPRSLLCRWGKYHNNLGPLTS